MSITQKLIHKGYDGADIWAFNNVLFEHDGFHFYTPLFGLRWIPAKQWEFAHEYVDRLPGK